MDPAAAIRHLEDLRSETLSDDRYRVNGLAYDDNALTSWRAKLRSVLVRALGESNNIVTQLDGTWFSPGFFYDGQSEREFVEARSSGMAAARGLIDAAIYELGLSGDESEVVEAASFDSALWAHVEGLIRAEDWTHVAPAVAIFVEDRVRAWGGLPTSMIGKGLYAKALADDGPLRLGAQGAEWEGWRALGMGLAQAVGNVVRHRVDRRPDARTYALGVLGIGSLLLTQIRWEHEDLVIEAEETRTP